MKKKPYQNSFLSVFEGFSYVGEYPTNSTEHDPHMNCQGQPVRFESKREYIFGHQLPVDSSVMAPETLPSRLKALGYDILSAPDEKGNGFIRTI